MKTNIFKAKTSLAILRISDKYILQLRDNRPGLAACGQWSLFGGQINLKESPLRAMQRELFEELSIKVKKLRFLWDKEYYYDFVKGNVKIWFFTADVGDVWSSHCLKEGQAAGIFSIKELEDLDVPDIIMQAVKQFDLEKKTFHS